MRGRREKVACAPGHADLSPKRGALCSRENALRVAERLQSNGERAIAVVRTVEPLQPFRVSTDPEPDGDIIIVVTS